MEASAFGDINAASVYRSSVRLQEQRERRFTVRLATPIPHRCYARQSHAFGFKNTASGNYSAAVGYSNVANHAGSSAFGDQNHAYNLFATAVGF